MQRRILIPALVGLAVALYACDDSSTGNGLPYEPEAQVERSPVAGDGFLAEVVYPGDTEAGPNGTMICRGRVIEFTLSGDITGSLTFEQTLCWNAEGDGVISGPVTAEVQWTGRSGTFTGEFIGTLSNSVLDGHFVALGDGGLNDYTWEARLAGPLGGSLEYSGDIVTYNGDIAPEL